MICGGRCTLKILSIVCVVIIIVIIIGFGVGYYFSKRITNPKTTSYGEHYNNEKNFHPDVIKTYEEIEKEEVSIEYLGIYDDVEFAVDNCGFTSFVEEAKFLLNKYCHINSNMLQRFVIFFASKVTKLRCGWSFNQVEPIRSIKNVKTPILFIHGDCDNIVPCQMCKAIFDAKQYGIKEKFEVKDADHTNALDKDKYGYINHLNKFLDSVSI